MMITSWKCRPRNSAGLVCLTKSTYQILTRRLQHSPQLDFEARDRGWLLDDLLITLSSSAGSRYCALSIKSNEQVTANGFPADFTKSIWEQARQASPTQFQMDRDLLALGVSRIATAAETAWDFLLRQALETDPERLVERLQADSGQSSDTQRKIFASLHCPLVVCPNGPNERETAAIIRSIRLLAWDFEAEPSQAEERALETCRSSLTRGEIQAISAATPDLGRLLLQPELQHLLCNLKVLDWIVTEETLRSSLVRLLGRQM